MASLNWQTLLGRILGRRYKLQRLLNEGELAAEFEGATSDGASVSITIASPGHMAPLDVLTSLEHPNIRRVRDGGSEEIDGEPFEYVVLDAARETLASRMSAGPLQVPSVAAVAASLARAFAYLHGRGLVYMHLAPENVLRASGLWQVGNVEWQLGNPEFSREPGNANPAVTRSMLSRSAYVPPEAYNGVVSPAWDVWSYGVLLRRALSGPPPQDPIQRRQRPPALPAPYDTLVAQCLEPEPHLRITFADIARALKVDTTPAPMLSKPAQAVAAAPVVEPPPVAPPAAEVPPAEVPLAEPAPVETPPAPPPQRRRARTYDVVVAPSSAVPPEPEPEPFDRRRRPRPGMRWAVALITLLVVVALFVYIERGRDNTQIAVRQPQPAANSHPPAETAQSKNRAVDTPPPAAPVVPEAKPSVDPSAVSSDATSRRESVYAFLNNWADTTRRLDAKANGHLYAPRVAQFFRRTNVSRDYVIREKSQLFRDIKTVRKYDISNVQIESLTPQRAAVNLRKEWDFRGSRSYAGAASARLILAWTSKGWQIAREQELHVDWTRRD